MDYPNFYENVKEAEMRLNHTIVLYDGEPYYVLCIADHMKDGILRIYLDKIGNPQGNLTINHFQVPYEYFPPEERGNQMDKFMEMYKDNPDMGIIRKMMNSPKFNRFRPFPLGMCNIKGAVTYIERTPLRNTQQGLTSNMLYHSPVTVSPVKSTSPTMYPNFSGPELYKTIMGQYPTASQCLDAMKNPLVGGANEAAAFHRHFALVRGPMDMLFLAYKSDIVGHLPNGDFSVIQINPAFRHTKEVIELLNLFKEIRT